MSSWFLMGLVSERTGDQRRKDPAPELSPKQFPALLCAEGTRRARCEAIAMGKNARMGAMSLLLDLREEVVLLILDGGRGRLHPAAFLGGR